LTILMDHCPDGRDTLITRYSPEPAISPVFGSLLELFRAR